MVIMRNGSITGSRRAENTVLQYIIVASLVEMSEIPECSGILPRFARHRHIQITDDGSGNVNGNVAKQKV